MACFWFLLVLASSFHWMNLQNLRCPTCVEAEINYYIAASFTRLRLCLTTFHNCGSLGRRNRDSFSCVERVRALHVLGALCICIRRGHVALCRMLSMVRLSRMERSLLGESDWRSGNGVCLGHHTHWMPHNFRNMTASRRRANFTRFLELNTLDDDHISSHVWKARFISRGNCRAWKGHMTELW